MKFLRNALVALAMLLAVACSKNSDKPSPSSTDTIEGTWVGKYGTGNNNPGSFFSFNIKANGVIEEIGSDGQVKGTGTWKLENKILSATYTWVPPSGTKFSVLGAFNAAQGKILGNWGYGNSVTDGGLWEMNKKN
jgi:hypothetical protein